MKFLACKQFGSLAPVDQVGEDALRKISVGTIVTIEVKRPRNGSHHRLYWALLTKVWENQSKYQTVEQLHTAIKLATGHFDLVQSLDGNEIKMPRATSYEKMDQLEFNEYYERVSDLLAKYVLPGVTSETLKNEIQKMIAA